MEGYVGKKVRNYGGLKSQDVKKVIFAFFKRPLTGFFFQIFAPKGFIVTPIDMMFKFREMWLTESR